MGMSIEDFSTILMAVGGFLGGTWITNFYNAKPKKNSIEIENMKSAMGELQNVIKQLTESSEIYRETTDKTIEDLQEQIAKLNIRIDIKQKSIISAYRCDKIKDEEECIVLKTFKDNCQDCNLKGDCKEIN